MTNMPLPLSFFLVPNCFIFDTASLIRNPNSKPKIDDIILYRLLNPKYRQVRFNKHRTTPKADNLIIFGFLIDLVLINNH